MKPIIDSVWNALETEAKYYNKRKEIISIDVRKRDVLYQEFKNEYNSIKNKHMKSNVDNLDRHKVAATIIVAVLKSQVIKYNIKIPKNKIFIGQEIIATEIALNWMFRSFSEELDRCQNGVKVTGYYMPVPWTCKTRYFDVFCRNLYYARKNYVLNPLDIADKLFLIEYVTLLEKGINPEILIYK